MTKNKPDMPYSFTYEFARELAEYFNVDTKKLWKRYYDETQDDFDYDYYIDWNIFIDVYPELMEDIKQYIEQSTSDISGATIALLEYEGCSLEWARSIVDRDKTGRNENAAYHMCRYFNAPREWAEHIIFNSNKTYPYPLHRGSVADLAYAMWRNCGSSEQWYKEVEKKHLPKVP